MRCTLAILTAAVVAVGCSRPQDIVLGPEPLKQLADQGEQFRKLPEEDRALLAGYLALGEMASAFGGDVKSVTGRTVGEVLADARAWKADQDAKAAVEKQRQAEADALRERVIAERNAIAAQISAAVSLAIVGKRVLPKNYDVARFSELLVISFAVENRSSKTIRQLKGRARFKDATGDEIGTLNIDIDEPVAVGKTLKTDTDRGWELNQFRNGSVEKIAGRDFDLMTVTFEPESIAFVDGEVIRAPDLPSL